jgi:hypothetical protein
MVGVDGPEGPAGETDMLARLIGAAALALAAFVLAPAAASAKVEISIDLADQTMRVETGNGDVHIWPISSGRKGFGTPRGTYEPYRLAKMHRSRKYNNAPMPHSIFFHGGYAIHATTEERRLGRPASHGCIRLSRANAAKLFAMVKADGAVIAINGSPPRDTMLASRAKPTSVASARTGQRVAAVAVATRAPTGPALGYAPVPRSFEPLEVWARNPGGWSLR